MSVFVHERGLNESLNVGDGTRIWAFAHVLPGAQVGADCNICDNVFIEGDARIGDRVTVKCGVQLWDGVTLEDDVFVGPNATFTNDRFPRSREWPEAYPKTIVRRGASIGANATILPGLEIGERAMVGAGAVVTRSVPRHAIVVGNPARIIGYADTETTTVSEQAHDSRSSVQPTGEMIRPTSVAGVTLHTFPVVRDLRGSLTAGEFDQFVPFVPKRYFMVFDVPGAEVRGEHAHRECHQFLLCPRGSVIVLADDGTNREQFVIDDNRTGVYLPPMTWGTQYQYSRDAVLLVFASHTYDGADYIREYSDFLEVIGQSGELVAGAAGSEPTRIDD